MEHGDDLHPAFRELEFAALEEKFVDLNTIFNPMGVQVEGSKLLGAFFYLVAEHLCFEELVESPATNEVDTSAAKFDEQSGWQVYFVEGFDETLSPTCAHELTKFLMGALLDLLDPPAELSDTVVLIIVWVLLEQIVVAITKNFGHLSV